MQNTASRQKNELGDAPAQEAASQSRTAIVFAACVFLITLTVCLVFHFTATAPHRTLCFDARQYLFDTSRITEFLLSAIHGKIQPDLLTDSKFVTAILSDGPAFPTVFGSLFAFLGHIPGIDDCRVIEIIQSIFHSISATLLFCLSFVLTGRRAPSSLAAGLAWGIYPAAIFWSGIFYTETTVIFFTLLFVLCLSQSKRLLTGLLAGLLGGFVALLKPALLPAAALASLLSLKFSKRSVAVVMLGAVLAIAPWVFYTKILTGHARITAQRFPAFNLAMGSDTEVDGCLVSPAPPLTTMFSRDDDMPLAFPMSQWEFHTADCLRMSAVKISSLWSRQANDFRISFFGVDPGRQNIWHLVLLFFGITGIAAFAASWRRSNLSPPQQTIAIASLVFIGTHFCYVLFTPAARYGMTAMPFFILFGAYALTRIGSYLRTGDAWRRPYMWVAGSRLYMWIAERCPFMLMNERPSSTWLKEAGHEYDPVKMDGSQIELAASAALAGLVIGLLCYGTYLSPLFKNNEIAHHLNPGDSMIRCVDLKAVKKPASIYSAFLLVDGDDAIENAKLSINGHSVHGSLKHIRTFDSNLYLQSFELKSLGYPSGIPTDSFRHWRAVPISTEWIKWDSPNVIELQSDRITSTVYADPEPNRHMLALNYFSVNSLCNSDTSLDLRIPSPIVTGNVKAVGWMRKDNGSESGGSGTTKVSFRSDKLKNSPRIMLALAPGQPYKSVQRPGELIFEKSVSGKDFDLYLQDPSIEGIRVSRAAIKASRSMGTVINLPNISSYNRVRICVSGELKGLRRGRSEIVVALQPAKQNNTLVLNMNPENIEYGNSWRAFRIEDSVPTNLLAENVAHSLYLACYPGPWLDFCGYPINKNCGDTQIRNLRVQILSDDGPDLASRKLLFY